MNTGAAKADDPENNGAREDKSAASGGNSLTAEEERQCRLAEIQAKIEDGVYSVDSLALSKRLIEKHLNR